MNPVRNQGRPARSVVDSGAIRWCGGVDGGEEDPQMGARPASDAPAKPARPLLRADATAKVPAAAEAAAALHGISFSS